MKFIYSETTFPKGKKHRNTEEKKFEKVDEVENEVLNLYPQVRYQTIEGFGGAVTDSAAYIYSLMDERQKEQVLDEYFHPEKMNYQMVRVPIDSCDFSLEHFEASSKENQEGFTLERAGKYIIPMLRDIMRKTEGRLSIMMTPWSPPAFMKTNGDRDHGGRLKDQYREQWAEYICRYVEEFQKLGFPVKSLSVQNEPKAVQKWDSCIFTAEEEKAFLKDYLVPALRKHGLDLKLYIWDHNKERALDRALTEIDEETADMIDGIAVHWYSGDHFEALQMIRELYPDKELILSEACIEYSKYEQGDCLENAKKYAHDLIGDLKHGLNGFYDWNLILDEKGGPNHVGNFCDAPYLYHTDTKELEERTTLAYLAHFCDAACPGAVRIGSSGYTEKLEAVAFAAEKNGKMGYSVVMLNQTREKLPVVLRILGHTVKVELEPESITSGWIM